jgi:uncharacterized protein
MKISDSDKLILHMLCDVHEALRIKNSVDPTFIRAAISGGHGWALEAKYTGIFGQEDSAETKNEVFDILDMWRVIEASYARLSEEEKARIEREAHPFGKDVQFAGFDGNHEGEHLSVARFIIDDMERYKEFKGRNLNSIHKLEGYRRMLAAYRPLLPALSLSGMSADELLLVLKAKAKPDNRPVIRVI